MKKTLLVLAILLAGCNSARMAQNNLEVEVGAEAFAVGHTPLTETLVVDHAKAEEESILVRELDKEHRQLANDVTLKYLWESGQDHELLDHVEKHYSAKVAMQWECRVFERRGHEDAAADCWTTLRGFGDDAQRVTRTKAVVDVFAGEDVHYGLQMDAAHVGARGPDAPTAATVSSVEDRYETDAAPGEQPPPDE